MALTEEQIMAQNFKLFYEKIFPYIGKSIEAGFTPIGTIIAVMGNTAPVNYLACNGQTVNIADYPELANYFLQQFGSKNHFGGNGTTTFAVPDLRGEFLRGTGTNSHENQGSGANVGVHQDGTEIPYIGSDRINKNLWILSNAVGPDGGSNSSINIDNVLTDTTKKDANYWKATGDFEGSGEYACIPRPTNTSVLYCIATKNIYMDPKNNYSTDEQVVGTWIDGKPIYQKTFILPAGTVSPGTDYIFKPPITNIILRNAEFVINKTNGTSLINGQANKDYYMTSVEQNINNYEILLLFRRYSGSDAVADGTLTLQYTKINS